MRILNVAAAQMGPIQKAESREAVVKRMLALLAEAKAKRADLVVYPELALTTFFPRYFMADQAEVDRWFEAEMPGPETKPLFEAAAAARHRALDRLRRAYAGRTSLQHPILIDRAGKHRRQIPQGASARAREFDPDSRVSASRKALLRAGRPRLSRVWRALGGILGMLHLQ